MNKWGLTPFVAFVAALAGAAAAGFDANDITLGASERRVKQRFPYANCRALEWASRAADRRCDDSRIQFSGVDARVTFYLKNDAVEGFDVRFHSRDWQHVTQLLRARYGPPAKEGGDRPRLEWRSAHEHAVLSAQPERRRASLVVWRGAFEEELYRIR